LSAPSSPLGKPVRREDWYYITENSMASCAVTVYPGELVVIQKKVYDGLAKSEIATADGGVAGVYLVHYDDLEALLTKNGFARL
jgi:hypothetical protein